MFEYENIVYHVGRVSGLIVYRPKNRIWPAWIVGPNFGSFRNAQVDTFDYDFPVKFRMLLNAEVIRIRSK